jgi:hypothetical protein
MKIKNETNGYIYFVINNKEPEKIDKCSDIEFVYGMKLCIFYKQSNGNNFYLIDTNIFINGIYTIYCKKLCDIICPPKLSFESFENENEYNQQQYIIVGEQIRNLTHTECYIKDCSCIKNLKDNLLVLKIHLNFLIENGIVTENQLNNILKDMFY